jgi:hypothetical protein
MAGRAIPPVWVYGGSPAEILCQARIVAIRSSDGTVLNAAPVALLISLRSAFGDTTEHGYAQSRLHCGNFSTGNGSRAAHGSPDEATDRRVRRNPRPAGQATSVAGTSVKIDTLRK